MPIYIAEIEEFVDENDIELVNEILRELKELKRQKKKEQLKAQIIEKLKQKQEWAEVLNGVVKKEVLNERWLNEDNKILL